MRRAAALLILTLAPAAEAKERWAVKTLTDPNAPTVDLRPVPTTIRALRLLAVPPETQGPFATAIRSAPVERTNWRVKARLIDVFIARDGDLHLLLCEPNDRRLTMIAEVPDIRQNRAFASTWARLREDVKKRAGFGATDRLIVIEGVGFFDPPHATRCAPNGIELHPVLAIEWSRP